MNPPQKMLWAAALMPTMTTTGCRTQPGSVQVNAPCVRRTYSVRTMDDTARTPVAAKHSASHQSGCMVDQAPNQSNTTADSARHWNVMWLCARLGCPDLSTRDSKYASHPSASVIKK